MADPLADQLNRIEAKLDLLLAGRSREVTPAAEDDPAADLRAACADMGIAITADGRVGEYGAAMLVGKSPQTLRNWRYAARPLPHSRIGGRIMYGLADLAAYLKNGG
ncbi:helix-turn-helix domain-containing protein [Mesorhizobium sp. M0622]|uniref:helix-turn-helix domain-containing protein n=1 Tax=Mesorhizobium sp. M0622 TaxID=2956975 RepID=UPI0033362F40